VSKAASGKLPIHYNRDMTHQKEIDIQFVNDLYLSAVNDGILYERERPRLFSVSIYYICRL
jgi:hypothetical protein